MQCPYCKETIQDGAIKCRYCSTMLGTAASAQGAVFAGAPPRAGAAEAGMFDYYMIVMKKYAEFSGRARRKEYWYFFLCNLIIAFVLGFIGGLVDKGTLFSNIYNLAVFVPGLAVAVRRMHDTGRSGWWVLLPLVNLVFLAQDSMQGSNAYGANPKGA